MRWCLGRDAQSGSRGFFSFRLTPPGIRVRTGRYFGIIQTQILSFYVGSEP